MIALWILGFIAVWFMIGCGIGAAIDAIEGNTLAFEWMKQCPFGYTIGVMIWPVWGSMYLWGRFQRGRWLP